MASVDVHLLNPGAEDVTVGAGPTEVVAEAQQITAAVLQDVSADAQGLLSGGVVIVPAGVDANDLAAFVADWAASMPEQEPEAQDADETDKEPTP
jgi:hypothetical protein